MTEGLVKVSFPLNSDDWHGCSVETLWAKIVVAGSSVLIAELENSPFYFKGVSYLDRVTALYRGGEFIFHETHTQSGHSTYRILTDKKADFENWWPKLSELGCSYESASERNDRMLYSVDVPPTANIHVVYAVLEAGLKEGVWYFEGGHVGHAL